MVRLNEDADTMFLTQPIGYTKALTDYLIEYANNSEIVKAQKAEPEKNILTGLEFAPEDDKQKAQEVKEYMANLDVSEKAAMLREDVYKRQVKTEKGVPFFSPAHFDLIIVDESHRSIFKKYKTIFEYRCV